MKKSVFILFLVFLSLELYPQKYPFDSIPDNLKRRSDAVIRTDQCLFTISKPGAAVKRIKRAITLLNSEASGYRNLVVGYDRFSDIKYIRGAVYDEKGIIVKALGLADIFDMSAINGGAFYSDDRMKVVFFPLYKFPYTIEYEYEISYSSLLNYPSWTFQESPDISVEKSGIQFIVPKDMKLRYYEEDLKNKVDSALIQEMKVYTWQEENLPAIPEQKYFVSSKYNEPLLHTAPMNFSYGGINGSMSSWNSFGVWVFELNKDRDLLPDSEVAATKEICSKASSTREKIKLIYEYVQAKTRYVSIQIGIGGFRTAEASAVAMNGFGDCKALVNYTKALLKVNGINSFYTLVKAGTSNDINTGFVDNQFNHVILCVPNEKDSVWLECTSQTLPFNYLGDFTAGRNVLMITPEGGKMVKTPGFEEFPNMLKRTGSIFLNILGASSGKMRNFYSGYYFETANSNFGMQSEDEMKEYLYSALRFSDFFVPSVKYSESLSEFPTALFEYQMDVKDFAIKEGSKIYFNPSVSKVNYLQDAPADLEVTISSLTSDSIAYNIPFGYKVEYLPGNIVINNEFGKFKFELEQIADKIIFRRYLELKKAEIPNAKYGKFREFINLVASTDLKKIILVKGI